jgi:hypothetical protein
MNRDTPLNNSRYFYGQSSISHKGVVVKTSVGSEMDDFIVDLDKRFAYKNGRLPIQHAHRPDLISNLFYGNVKWWWMILQSNGFNDPFEQLNAGDIIRIPKL